MDNLEQLPPNKPNFTLVVILFVVVIFVLLIVSYLFVRKAEMRTPDGQKSTSTLQYRSSNA